LAYQPIVQWGTSIFLGIELSNGNTGLTRFSTTTGKVDSSIQLNPSWSPEIFMWDYTTATMWAWIATQNYAGSLVTLNITSGNIISTIVNFPWLSANGGTSVIDLKTKIVYASLLNIQNGDNSPVWVVVDTIKNTSTTTPTNQGYPINIAIPV